MARDVRETGALGLWPVTAIGIGGMVGGGIFAVLGLATELAAGGTPAAFALAGGVALLSSSLWILAAMAGFALSVEWIYRRATGRTLRPHLKGPLE